MAHVQLGDYQDLQVLSQSYFPAASLVCMGAWGCSFPGAGLHVLDFMEFLTAHFPSLLEILLDGSMTFWHIRYATWFCVISRIQCSFIIVGHKIHMNLKWRGNRFDWQCQILFWPADIFLFTSQYVLIMLRRHSFWYLQYKIGFQEQPLVIKNTHS